MQIEFIKNFTNFRDLIKEKKEEENFERIFSSIFKRNYNVDEKFDTKLYFQESISFDNTKQTINHLEGKMYGNQRNNFQQENKNFFSTKIENEEIENYKKVIIDNYTKINTNSLGKKSKTQIHNRKEKLIIKMDEINDNQNESKDIIINDRNTDSNGKRKIWIRGPYKKKNKYKFKAKIDEISFPFNKGKGLINSFDDYRLIISNNKKIKDNNLNTIFEINHYFKDSKGKLKKLKKQRKFKSDDIRKKIKVTFHKELKNIINENLKKSGSEKLFSFLPQTFLGNITKKFNKKFMNSTYEDLISMNFTKDHSKDINLEIEQKHYVQNINVLKYLEKNLEISANSGFDKIKKMKYRDLLENYFLSKEFENTIAKFKNKRETDEYIKAYILCAKNYINYFSK